MYARFQDVSRFAAVFLVSLALAGCDIAIDGHGGLDFGIGAQAKDEWTRTYPLAAGGRLEVINVNGRITAEVSEGNAVEVRAERTGKASTDEGARDVLRQIEIREEASEGRVRLEARTPRLSGPQGHDVKWTIKVPRGVAVDLRTTNGGVQLAGLDGEIRARSTNGGITGKALQATSVDAAVTNGGVEINLAKAVTSGDFDLEATNGGVSLNLPADSKADILGRCTNGGVSVSGLDLQLEGEQDRRRVAGKLNGGGARVTLRTTNGGVKIGRI